jgi:hypothetical protein
MSPSYHETSNIYQASYLLHQGCTFLGFQRPSARRVVFRFAAEPKLHEALRVYWNANPVAVVPAALFGSLRRLKSLVRRKPSPASSPRAQPGRTSPQAPIPDGEVTVPLGLDER